MADLMGDEQWPGEPAARPARLKGAAEGKVVAGSSPPRSAKPQARTPSNRERDRFVGFAFAAADLLVETDRDGVIRFAAGARCRLTPEDVSTLNGVSLLDLVAQSDQRYVRILMGRIVAKTRITPARVVFQSHDGHRFPALLGGCYLDSCPDSLFLSILLASSPRAAHPTGAGGGELLDAKSFTGILEERVVNAREKGLDHGVTLLLIDGMQTMVDQMPEGAAQEVRQGIDAYLRGISTDGDSASRLAPDRYGVVHAADFDGEELRGNIARIIKDAGGDLDGGIRSWSLDVADTPLEPADAARALVYTVQAFATEQAGEFTIASLEDGAKRMLTGAVERIGRLRATIERRDFFVVFQPIVDIHTQSVHHLEALTRVEGMPSPADFITFAEDVGLIYDFDLLLCQSVLDTLQAYRKEPKLPDVAINLSAKTLMSPLFLRQFQAITEPYGELARKLLIEVTETVVVTDIGQLNEVLQKLRAAGYRVCLDDVGSGSTSFQSIYGLRVDFAKIDGSFVRNAENSHRDMAVLRSMVDVCRQLGLRLIGEQVERPEHAKLLAELEVPLAQGFLYGRPSRDFAYFAKDWSKLKGGKVLNK